MACRSISFSEVPQYSDDIPPASSCHHPDHLVWTAQLEQQLQYAQEQLAIAQSNWSEDQEIWINEIEDLEDIRHAHEKLMRQNDRRRAKWAIDRWRARARMSPGEGDSGEDGSASEYERAENGSQEAQARRISLGNILQRVNSRRPRRAFTEGELPTLQRRESSPEQPQSPAKFRRILKRWSWRGAGFPQVSRSGNNSE